MYLSNSKQNKMKNAKKFATLYREKLNWSVIPLRGKRPIINWKAFQKRLPGLRQIDLWWSQFPEANIGVVTGKISGIVVFDCDSQKALNYVEEKGLVETVCVQSSTTYKKHFYYKYPDLKAGEIRTIDGRSYYGLDIDVKGNGGVAVLPPSIHEKLGTPYKWINSPAKVAIADLDIWQLEFCMEARKRKNKRIGKKYYPKYSQNPDWLELVLKGVSKGRRDNVAFSIAKYYARRGFTKYEVEDKLFEWNRRNRPPLIPPQINKCVRSAFNYVR